MSGTRMSAIRERRAVWNRLEGACRAANRCHAPLFLLRPWVVGLVALLSLLLASCGATSNSPPQPLGGSYTNAQFLFSLTYPSGWQVNG